MPGSHLSGRHPLVHEGVNSGQHLGSIPICGPAGSCALYGTYDKCYSACVTVSTIAYEGLSCLLSYLSGIHDSWNCFALFILDQMAGYGTKQARILTAMSTSIQDLPGGSESLITTVPHSCAVKRQFP